MGSVFKKPVYSTFKVLCVSLLLLSFLQTGAEAAGEKPEATTGGTSSLTNTGKKTLIVAKGAAFGLGGGLVVGLASQVFKRNSRNIFLFGSLGMYAGMAMGLYLVMAPRGSTPYEGPDTYEDFNSSSIDPVRPEEGRMASVSSLSNQVNRQTNIDIQMPLYSLTF